MPGLVSTYGGQEGRKFSFRTSTQRTFTIKCLFKQISTQNVSINNNKLL